MVQYNNVQEKDRLSGKDGKVVLCCQMAILHQNIMNLFKNSQKYFGAARVSSRVEGLKVVE